MEKVIKNSVDRIMKGMLVAIIFCLLVPALLYVNNNEKIEELQQRLNTQIKVNQELISKIEKLETRQINHSISIFKLEKKQNGK